MEEKIKKLSIGQILKDEEMSKHTSFKIGGPANLLCLPDSYESVQKLISFLQEENADYYVIGNGTNLLVSDQGLDIIVIKLSKNLSKIRVEGDLVYAQAGASLTETSKMSMREGLTGMEPVSGIPGTIGGAVAMNAGAYGTDISDIIISATVLNNDNEIEEIGVEDLGLGYRKSRVLEEGLIVLGANFRLKEGNIDEIRSEYEKFKDLRVSKQPLDKASGGSTFKRPEGHYAAKLIEDAGLKGYSYGKAKVSEKHAGFVIADKGASFDEVMEVISHVQDQVYEKFSVSLEPEIRILGGMDDSSQ